MRNALAVILALGAISGCGKSPAANSDVVPATLATPPEIPYPPDLFARRIEGEVVLYLVIDSSGTALRDSTRVSHSSGQAAFDAAALDAAATLRFTPARKGGVAITAPLLVPMKFTLPDSIKHPRDHK